MPGGPTSYYASLAGHYFRRLAKRTLEPPQALLGLQETNGLIGSLLDSGKAFMAARFGGTEARACAEAIAIQRGVKTGFSKRITRRMDELSGFFPSDRAGLLRFWERMQGDISQLDLLGWWRSCLQDYLIGYASDQGLFSPDLKMCALASLEPYYILDEPQSEQELEQQPGQQPQPQQQPQPAFQPQPWSRHLEGKRVLVVHPFAKSIESQYKRRSEIWEGSDVLPPFDLITYPAVQTIAGQRDERFPNWFDALAAMEEDIAGLDYDVAIIGCGAYGFPLASFVKRTGHQAIHLAGATQILFGIMGKRWETNGFVAAHCNGSWVRPLPEETPENASSVENACYW